jgi:hypothetical protein
VFHDAFVDGDRLVLAYTALVTDQFGRPLERTERRAAVALADLGREDLAVEDLPVDHPLARAPLRGLRVPLRAGGDGPDESRAFLQVEASEDPHLTRLLLHDPPVRYTPLYASALLTTHTAPWAYPLVPLALALDVAVDPVLLFLAPAVIFVGD